MKSEHWKLTLAGIVLLAAAAGFLMTVVSLLGRTELYEIYLWDSVTERSGWRYEILQDGAVQEVEPVFPDQWSACLPGDAVQAVRMSRTMTEDMRAAGADVVYPVLELEPYDSRVEVLLDGQLLAADVEGGQRDENGFLILDGQTLDAMRPEYRKVMATLPDDYLGRTLTIVIYYAQPRQTPTPPYPMLYTDQSLYAPAVTYSVQETVMLTVCAILTMLVLSVFVMDARSGRPDWPMLLLALHFLLLFLDKAYSSTAGQVSMLYGKLDLAFLSDLYMAPMYIYLALRFNGWKRVALCCAAVGWALFEAVLMFLQARRGDMFLGVSYGGTGAYLLLLLFAGAFLLEWFFHWRREGKRVPRPFILLTAAVLLARLLYGARRQEYGGVAACLKQLLYSCVPIDGYPNFMPIVNYVMDVCSIMAVLLLLWSFVRRTVRTRETISALSERSRLTMEGYERMLRAEEATNAVRHEMHHHMTALAGIVQDGDTARAAKYIAAVDQQLERLPTGRYSPNILVNVIAGNYLDQAREEGIETEHSLLLPEELSIPDEELSVFLTNMLENALQACRRMDPAARRYIRLKMHLHEKSLFIGCVNSTADEQGQTPTEPRESRRHGYGLEAMKRIAEKYSSILVTERTPGEFSVRSNLHLP